MTKKEFFKRTNTSESSIRIINGISALEAIEQFRSSIAFVDITIFEEESAK